MAKVLILRFSALGDVSMMIPLLYSLGKRYPKDDFYLLSRNGFGKLLTYAPSNVHFIGADFAQQHKGAKGLWKLYQTLCTYGFTHVADLHDVLRSHFFRLLFRWRGIKTVKIDKGRREKKALTQPTHKKCHPIKTTLARYQTVFEKLGFDASIEFDSIFEHLPQDKTLPPIEKEIGKKAIGIAPFAKHRGKIYPLPLMEQVIASLCQIEELDIYLFGGGATEKKIVEEWSEKYPIISTIGKYSMDSELKLMQQLDLMLTMDSGNMHLASLVGTRVISIWGATHPYAGFLGYGQSENDVVQIALPCRPCSIFGSKPCYLGTWECMQKIDPAEIVERVKKAINT